jgi:hypothetical protein
MQTACADTGQPPDLARNGAAYEITRNVISKGSIGGSMDRDTLVQRVTGVRPDGVELEYDLPANTPAQVRAAAWQFPVRIFKPTQGNLQLLNGPELEVRVDAWLKQAGLPRTLCGRYYFSWNVFRIECDPLSTLHLIEPIDLGFTALKNGALYRAPLSSSPVTVRRKWATPYAAEFVATLNVDPDHVRRDQAQADVVIAEITKKPLTFDDALRARSAERIAGTMEVTFETDQAGLVRRRTTLTKVQSSTPNGPTQDRTITETVERRLISDGSSKSNDNQP